MWRMMRADLRVRDRGARVRVRLDLGGAALSRSSIDSDEQLEEHRHEEDGEEVAAIIPP